MIILRKKKSSIYQNQCDQIFYKHIALLFIIHHSYDIKYGYTDYVENVFHQFHITLVFDHFSIIKHISWLNVM